MLNALNALVAPAMMQRLTLALNHVLSSERVATDRLRAHAGRRLQVHLDGWPSLLPAPPAVAFLITPAGLLEWCGDTASANVNASAMAAQPADLQVRVDASNPALLMARTLAGEAPTLEIQGDAAFATDINWLADNLRWDAEADLERIFGPRAAHELSRLGSMFASGLRSALRGGADLAGRLRPGGPERHAP
jgi:ubiquinone biosynthesis protein UbiJ